MRKRRWLWILLFIWVAALLAILATGWNVVLVRDYYQMVQLARKVSMPNGAAAPWPQLVFGTLGFIVALGMIVLLFAKLLAEMRLNQQQSEFLAAVTHELKSPLAALELSSTLIRSGELSAQEIENLWNSHQGELKRLREDVETLLQAARLEAGPNRMKKVPVELDSWLSESIKRWTFILGPGAVLRREGDPLPGKAMLDTRALNLITDNILDNARKFARGTPQVTIVTRRMPARRMSKAAHWRIEFRDEGWGFDPLDSHRIFGRFFRGKSTAPYAIAGTGLGLYLARAASRALGITIHGVSAGFGQGASFILEGRECLS